MRPVEALRGTWGQQGSFLENAMLDLGLSGWGELVLQSGGWEVQHE